MITIPQSKIWVGILGYIDIILWYVVNSCLWFWFSIGHAVFVSILCSLFYHLVALLLLKTKAILKLFIKVPIWKREKNQYLCHVVSCLDTSFGINLYLGTYIWKPFLPCLTIFGKSWPSQAQNIPHELQFLRCSESVVKPWHLCLC